MKWQLLDITVYGREVVPNDRYNNRVVVRVQGDAFGSVLVTFDRGDTVGLAGDIQYPIQRPVFL